MTDDDLRDILHYATHEALPPAPFIAVQARAHIQVQIADTVIGAIRALEHGADSFGGLVFATPSRLVSPPPAQLTKAAP